ALCSLVDTFSLHTRRLPPGPLHPYTTLFRSISGGVSRGFRRRRGGRDSQVIKCEERPRRPEPGLGRRPGSREPCQRQGGDPDDIDRKSTRLNSSHVKISYAVFCVKKNSKVVM